MNYEEVMESAFRDELEKIGASFKRLSVPKSRSGRRSISVDKLLKKEKDGTLFRKHGMIIPVTAAPEDASAAKNKKKGDAPSREDTATSIRQDGRENAVNITGPATLLRDIGGDP